MSSEVAISLNNVSKTYRVYGKPHHRLLQAMRLPRREPWFREFHALRGVTTVIRRGETVGIVGRNGSGKSTLLQVICGTLRMTGGDVNVSGRIAALLELGAGFNPEFTGRENVYLNGAVLGLSRADIDERFDSIVAFADIGDFVDQPVKTYSSGMYVRLAFSVAISIEPQILVVDEALSVGDEAFQRKCFSRIEDLKRAGATILFVSHSAGSIIELCDRAILVDDGELLLEGDPKSVVARYQKLLYAPPARRPEIRAEIRTLARSSVRDGVATRKEPEGEVGTPSVTKFELESLERFDEGMRPESTVEYASIGARISDPHFLNFAGAKVNVLIPGADYTYRYKVRFEKAASGVHFGMMLKSLSGLELFGMASHAEGDAIPFVAAGDEFEVDFKFRSDLLPGTYFTNAGCNGALEHGDSGFLHRILDAAMFKIEAKQSDRRKVGFYDLAREPACSYRRLDNV
ncbi:ABC transporter ATP-binding protein [Pseudoxanthomonas mexicana]